MVSGHGREEVHPSRLCGTLAVIPDLVRDIPKGSYATTTQTSFYHSFIYFVLNTTGLYIYSCQDSHWTTALSIHQKPHSNLNPNLTFTLKPSFNPQTALWHRDNQPKCPCFPKITLLCKYNVYFFLMWHEQEHTFTHTNTQLYWSFSCEHQSELWGREKGIKWIHSQQLNIRVRSFD